MVAGFKWMHALDGVKPSIDDRPQFANFFKCTNPTCTTLCFDHHVHSDSDPITQDEVFSTTCRGTCLREFCHSPSCRCFWKQQEEIINKRKYIFKLVEKNNKKCLNYKSEIDTLRATMENSKSTSFSEEVEHFFGDVCCSFRSLENEVKQGFCKTLFRFEVEAKERDMEIEKLKQENISLKRKLSELEAENKNLTELKRKRVQVFS